MLGLRYEVLGDHIEPTDSREALEGHGAQKKVSDMNAQGYGSNTKANSETDLTLDGPAGRKDEITLRVSHESLTHNLCPMSNKGVADRIKLTGPNGETMKTKEKPLKEITNKLVAQPINIKPSWARLRRSLEKSKGNVEEQLNS